MTEAEWVGNPHPIASMLYHLTSMRQVSSRKLRLYFCACCSSVEAISWTRECRAAVDMAERFADGGATETERASLESRFYEGMRSAPDSTAFIAALLVCKSGRVRRQVKYL